MDKNTKETFYKSKRLIIDNIIGFSIIIIIFLGISSVSLMVLADLYKNGFGFGFEIEFGRLLVSLPLITPFIIIIYLVLGIRAQLIPENNIICEIDNHTIYFKEHSIWIRKRTIVCLEETSICIDKIEKVYIKKIWFLKILKLEFNHHSIDINKKRKIENSLNRISIEDKLKLKNIIETTITRNQILR